MNGWQLVRDPTRPGEWKWIYEFPKGDWTAEVTDSGKLPTRYEAHARNRNHNQLILHRPPVKFEDLATAQDKALDLALRGQQLEAIAQHTGENP